MNHQKIYESIIQKAKVENRKKLKRNQEGYVYYENHHIYPQCLGWCDEDWNMQLLTAKEHYICHKLLTYIYIGNRKIACAFHKMTFSKKYGKIVSGRDYAYAKELISITPVSKETREKLSKKGKGRSSKKRGTHLSEKTKKKLSEKGRGRKVSEETKKKMKKKIPWNKGKKASKKTKQKMSKSHKGISMHTEQFKIKLAENNKLYKTGTTHSIETKIKMSKTRKRVKKTEEHKRKIRESRKRYFEKRKSK